MRGGEKSNSGRLRAFFRGGVMVAGALLSSASVEWETPQELFEKLNGVFQFTLDVCATKQNTKVAQRYFTKQENGLKQSWGGERCWMNPPYGREIGAWTEKARMESGNALIVGLLPVRTDTRWWQRDVIGHADIRFLAGRLRFGGARNCAPFPSAVVLWWGWPQWSGRFE